MKDETRYILDDLLAEWHRWASGWQAVATHGASAMFTGVKSSRQWDSENEATDASLHNTQMKAFDFHVGELEPLHSTALQIQARNLVTGRSVWTSARLPQDPVMRLTILIEARINLTKRLTGAGLL